MESKSINIKRKIITGHSLKEYYKKLRRRENVKEFEGPHIVYDVCEKNNEGSTGKALTTCIKGSKEKSVSYKSEEEQFCSHNDMAGMELDGSSACKKFKLRDKVVESENNSTIKKIQRKCDIRMKKLIQKQEKENEEFHQVWNDKILRLEKDNRLEANMIWLIYGESLNSVEKLRMLDSSFRKKMEEHNILKVAQLKDVEMEQLSARNLEKQKAENWLSCCNSEQPAGWGEFSQDLLTNEDGGCLNIPVSERVCDELESVEPNKVVLVEASDTVDQVEPENLCNPFNEGDAILCPDTLMNQRVETDESLPVTEEIMGPLEEASSGQSGSFQKPVPEGQIHASLVRDDPEESEARVLESSGLQIRDANSEPAVETDTVGFLLAEEIMEPRQEASSAPEVQIQASLVTDNPKEIDAPVLESGTSQIRDTNSELADTVIPMQTHVEAQTNMNCEQTGLLSIDSSPSLNLHPATDVEGQNNDSGLNLFQTTESAGNLVIADESSQGPEDHIHESSASADLQDTDSLVQQGQGTLQIEVEASEPVDTVQFHSEVLTIGNAEQLHPMSTDVSPCCNPSPATAVEHRNPELVRNFSPTSQVVEDLLQLNESSQIERDLEIQSRCLDMGSASRVAYGSGAHMSTHFLDNMALPQVVADAEECANQSVPQLGVDADNVHGSSSTLFLDPNHIVNSPFWYGNQFENELKEVCNKGEQLDLSYKDVMSSLKSDREKEIQEIVAQIRSKYEMKLKASKDDLQLKISNHQKQRKKIYANKALAFAFSAAAPIASWPVVQQGMPSGSSRQLQQSQQLQSPLQSSAGQPSPFLHPTAHTWQNFAIPHPTGHVTSRNIAAPVQSIQHTAVQSSGNLHVVGQIHPSPYWPVFRPTAPSSMYPAGGHVTFLPLYPLRAVTPPPPLPSWQVQSHNRVTAMHNPFFIAPSNYNCAPPLRNTSSSFNVLESSYLEGLGNVHSGNPYIAAASGGSSSNGFLVEDN